MIELATGEHLDALAALHGVAARSPGQDDASYRRYVATEMRRSLPLVYRDDILHDLTERCGATSATVIYNELGPGITIYIDGSITARIAYGLRPVTIIRGTWSPA